MFESVRSSFGAKLGVALLAVVALVVGFGFVVQEETSAALEDEVRTELSTSAETRAAELDTWISGIEGQVRLHSTRSVIQSGDTGAISRHLKDTAERDALPDGVVAVHYYSMDEGTIQASSMPRMEGVNPAEEGAPFATDPPTFDGTDDTYVTAPFTVPVVDFPVVSVISPVEGADGKALIYMIDLRSHTESFAQTAGQGSTVVVDGEGRIVAHPDSEMLLRSYERDIAALSEGGFAQRENLLVAGAQMETLEWTVLARSDRATAYALGDQITSFVVGLILLVTALFLLLIGQAVKRWRQQPRPVTEEEIVLYGPHVAEYYSIRPGITGLWQVSGRNHLSFASRVNLDVHYIQNWSPWLDLYLLVRTGPVVLSGEGAS